MTTPLPENLRLSSLGARCDACGRQVEPMDPTCRCGADRPAEGWALLRGYTVDPSHSATGTEGSSGLARSAPTPVVSRRARDPMIGRLIAGKYRVQGVLGGGSAGRVYRAVQEPIGRLVAVKVLRADLPVSNRHALEVRFLREAALTGGLQHPNVVTVYDYGRTEEGQCYIAMELVRGLSFRRALQLGPMEVARGLSIVEQIVRGLRCVHGAGLVHRDIKPANIILQPDPYGGERAKVVDFGLVKNLGDAGFTDLGTVMGTPRYMAPEQARGEEVDHRADIYSVGVIMYQTFTGETPYQATSAMAMAIKHIKEPYPRMAERAPDVHVPEELEEIVRRCMEKQPRDRYNDTNAMLADLVAFRKKYFADKSYTDVPMFPAITDETPGRIDRPLPTGTLVLAGLAAVTVVALAVVLSSGGNQELATLQGDEPLVPDFVAIPRVVEPEVKDAIELLSEVVVAEAARVVPTTLPVRRRGRPASGAAGSSRSAASPWGRLPARRGATDGPAGWLEAVVVDPTPFNGEWAIKGLGRRALLRLSFDRVGGVTAEFTDLRRGSAEVAAQGRWRGTKGGSVQIELRFEDGSLVEGSVGETGARGFAVTVEGDKRAWEGRRR